MRPSSMLSQTVAVVVALIVVLLLIRLVPSRAFVPHGIVLPTQISKAPVNPNQVRLYRSIPADAKNLGQLSIQLHAVKGANPTLDQARLIAKARDLAASVGANGITFQLMFGRSSEGSALNNYILRGFAFLAPVSDDLKLNFISPSDNG